MTEPSSAGAWRLRLVYLLWLLVGLLAVGIAVVAPARLRALLNPPIVERAPPAAGCDLLRGPCAAVFADGAQVRLDVRPRGIPVVHPLRIEVEIAGMNATRGVALDLAGVDMDMGYNRFDLAPGAGEDRWIGQAMLPVCVRARMTWEARVLVYTDAGVRSAPFRFDAVRPSGP